MGLFDRCLRALMPGGIVIFETPDPDNLQVASDRFYLDPTHRKPLPAELITFLLEARGLCHVETLPLHPLEAPGVETYDDAMLDLLRRKLFGPRDYGVIARKRS